MRNKIIKLIIVFLFTALVTILFFRVLYGEPSISARYVVYQKGQTNLLSSMFRIIPTSKSAKIIEEVIQKNKDFELVLVIDKRYSPPEQYYFLKTNNELKTLKSPIPLANNKRIDLDNYFSHLIDKETFNLYIQAFYPYIEKESIIEKYCFFLSTINDTSYYHKIKDSLDISRILKNHPVKSEFLLPEHKIISVIKEIKDTNNTKNIRTVYWFFDKGVIELCFQIKGNKIDSIETKFLGFLGNETLHI